RYAPSDQPAAELKVVLPRENEHEYQVNHRDGVFYIRTNKGAKNYRLVTAPADDPSPKSWKEMIRHRADVLLENVDLFVHHAVVSERANGLPKRRIIDLRSGKDHGLEFPEPVYSVFNDANPEYQTTVLRYRYQSLI